LKVDLRLYGLIDPERLNGRSPSSLAKDLATGGATLVQLRDKRSTTRGQVTLLRELRAVLDPLGVPLIMNDRVDVVLAAGAKGVHLGEDDMQATDARRLLGAPAIIGLSVRTQLQAEQAPLEVLDYVVVGGVFASSSKTNPEPPIGVRGLGDILACLRRRAPDLPVGAIAGIHAGNAAEVIAAGADGVAVISALSLAPDAAAATRRLLAIVDASLKARR
jgi:thiamine-phosphate pyrophosphorylase